MSPGIVTLPVSNILPLTSTFPDTSNAVANRFLEYSLCPIITEFGCELYTVS